MNMLHRILKTAGLATGLACAGLTAGCGHDDATPTSTVSTSAAWKPQAAPASGPAVYLGEGTIQGDRLRLAVRGKGIDTLYGVSFRLEYDAEVLQLASMTKGEAWTSGGDIVRGKEARAGLLVGVVSSKGAASGVKVQDDNLAWLEFTILKQAATKVGFVQGRCAVVQPDGSDLSQVQWSAGELVMQ